MLWSEKEGNHNWLSYVLGARERRTSSSLRKDSAGEGGKAQTVSPWVGDGGYRLPEGERRE